MNFIRQLTLTMLLALSAIVPPSMHATWSESDGVYYLRTMDGLDDPYTVNGSITFKSQSGSTIPGYKDCGTVFVPANTGEVISIKIEDIDLDGTAMGHKTKRVKRDESVDGESLLISVR